MKVPTIISDRISYLLFHSLDRIGLERLTIAQRNVKASRTIEPITPSKELSFILKGGKYIPNYDNPATLNEKIHYYWCNYYSKTTLLKCIQSKIAAKKYVASLIDEQYIIKTIGEYSTPKEIDFDSLPDEFVLKAIWGSSGSKVLYVLKIKNS